MKDIKNYFNCINESFSRNDLMVILSAISDKLMNEEGKLSFSLNIGVKGIRVNTSEVLARSIGHVVEGVIKAAFPDVLNVDGAKTEISIEKQGPKAPFDLKANDSKFEIKAALNGKFDSVNMSKEERKNVDYLLVVDYTIEDSTVEINDMYIADISGEKMTGKHMNKAIHGSAVHLK